jgi:serine/threonine protein phosphatase PrpC
VRQARSLTEQADRDNVDTDTMRNLPQYAQCMCQHGVTDWPLPCRAVRSPWTRDEAQPGGRALRIGLDLHPWTWFRLRGVDDLVPIGEFSARSGLSPKRLRSYAAGGLLVPAAVDAASGYRYYSPGQLREAELIDALRGAGMPLADIRALLRRPSGEQLDTWARRLENDAEQRQTALALARRLLALGASSATAVDDRDSSGDNQHPEGKGPIVKLNAASRTEIGQVREKNEDTVVTSQCLVGVADGMGGAPGGQLASTLAVALAQAAFTGRSAYELAAAVRAANRAIWERARVSAELEGMGTTICAVGLIEDGTLAVVNVGDSRTYLAHDGSLTQLTHDHSVTGELVRRGDLTEEEALHHPHRSVLTRALGVGPDVELDSGAYPAVAGDRLLVCTDGLFNEVPADDIASAMAAAEDVQATADRLVELALSGGGRDNVSVVVAEIGT